jgi:adenylate cyclase
MKSAPPANNLAMREHAAGRTDSEFLERLQMWLRPLTHAGVPQTANRSEERQLVTANIVILLSILVTIPDIWVFYSVPHLAMFYAGSCALGVVCIYVIGFLFLVFGKRGIGVFLFTNGVFFIVAVNTLLTGTDCGIQYYFVPIAIGAMFVWPRVHARMRFVQAGIGLVLFYAVMTNARAGPIIGPSLPRKVLDSMLVAHIVGAYVAAFGIAAYSVFVTERAESALESERQKSESLLLNILPEAIATRLKEGSQLIADGFDSVTILFADIVGFTPMSDRLPPAQVVEFLSQMFSRFDLLAERYGLEKIKTIGDAYMVAGGIPVANAAHARAVAEMAIEMVRVVENLSTPNGHPIHVRIGIHSGPAIAGVIGLRKYSYDIWGDTVNTASRMESHGLPGRIQVTNETRLLLQDEYEFEERGLVDVKGKGPMKVYLLSRRRSDAVVHPDKQGAASDSRI